MSEISIRGKNGSAWEIRLGQQQEQLVASQVFCHLAYCLYFKGAFCDPQSHPPLFSLQKLRFLHQ